MEWPASDWLLHFQEEDRFFRPLMKKHCPIFVDSYDEDHVVFRRELETYGRIVSVERLEQHTKTENFIATVLTSIGY